MCVHSASTWGVRSTFPVSRWYGGVQLGATSGRPWDSISRRSLAMSASLSHQLRPAAWPRIVGPRLFWRSCVLAFLKDCLKDWEGRPGNDVLPHREGRSTDGGIADAPRRKTPLVLPCEGRDAGARVAPNLRVQGLSLLRGRAHNLRVRVLSLAGGRRSSSGERPRGSCEATKGSCGATQGSVKALRPAMGRHGSLRSAPAATGASPTGATSSRSCSP